MDVRVIIVGNFSLRVFDWQTTSALKNSACHTLQLDINHGNLLTRLVDSPTREENILEFCACVFSRHCKQPDRQGAFLRPQYFNIFFSDLPL